jgi:hypothetical protein
MPAQIDNSDQESTEAATHADRSSGASRRLAEWIVRLRWPLLVTALVMAGLAWTPAKFVQYDRSIENMFASDDPLLPPYRLLKRQFGGNEIVMAVYADPQLLADDGGGISKLAHVTQRLRNVPGVKDILSLAEVNAALENTLPFGRLLKRADAPPAIVDRNSEWATRFRELFEGYTHDARGDIAALACMLEPVSESTVPRIETIEGIREIIQKQPQGMIAGEPVMVVDGFRYVEEDGQRLGWSTTILLALTILACFRSIRWVAVPLLVVQLTLLLTRATLYWTGLRLSMVSSMLTAIVTVVGVATVVHVIVRFRQARTLGLAPRAAMVQTLSILALPVFWACSTDAVGFLSLMVAKVGPVQDFGVMTAIGAMLVLLCAVLIVPGLALLGHFDTDPKRMWGEHRLGMELDRVIHWVEHHPRMLMVLVFLLLVLSTLGLLRLEVETDFTKNFRRGTPIVVSYEFIEQRLGGAGVWDVVLPAPATLNEGYLRRVRELEDRLRKVRVKDARGKSVSALTKVLSLVDGVDAVAVNPLMARVPAEIRAQGMATTMPTFVAALRTNNPSDEQNYLRIMLRAREQQPAAEKAWLIDEVRRLAVDAFPADEDSPGAEVTGFYVLLTNLIKSVLRDQWVCFLVATIGIGLMMRIAFRSAGLAVLALVPNALPILFVLGALGWFGLRINMGAAMIAAVSMGLSVDSSIHYVIAFRRARNAGRGVTEAIEEVQQTVGRAVVFSTMALMVGFLVLCSSKFVPTIYFGALAALSMLGGLLGNLLVLPLLLHVFASSGSRDRTDG